MNRTSRASLPIACLNLVFLTMGCAPQMPGATADGTWSGQDQARMYDFNAPLNWMPRGVPTGTATIPAEEPPVPFIRFTDTTNLAAIKLTGNLGFTVEATRSVTAHPGGVTLCCRDASIDVNGEFTGNVTIGSQGGQTKSQVGGYGTIKGNVFQNAGTFGASKGPSGEKTLKIVGDYRLLGSQAALLTNVWGDGPGAVAATGNATLDGGVLVIAIGEDVKGSIPPFKALTATGISGRFAAVYVYPAGTATVQYNAQDVTVSVRR
jgi:hypothetical protein